MCLGVKIMLCVCMIKVMLLNNMIDKYGSAACERNNYLIHSSFSLLLLKLKQIFTTTSKQKIIGV
jgi:hypothetical protein